MRIQEDGDEAECRSEQQRIRRSSECEGIEVEKLEDLCGHIMQIRAKSRSMQYVNML